MRLTAHARLTPFIALLVVGACSDDHLIKPKALGPHPVRNERTADGTPTWTSICKRGPVGAYQFQITANNVPIDGSFIGPTVVDPSITSPYSPTLNITWNGVNQQTGNCMNVYMPATGGAPNTLGITDLLSNSTQVEKVEVMSKTGSHLYTYGPGSSTITWPDPNVIDPSTGQPYVVDDQHPGYDFTFWTTADRGQVDFCKFAPTAPGTYNFTYSVSGGGGAKFVTPQGLFSVNVTLAQSDPTNLNPSCVELFELPPGSGAATVTVFEFPSLGSDLAQWELWDENNLFGSTAVPLDTKPGNRGASSYAYSLTVSYPQRRMLRSFDEPAPLPRPLTNQNKQACSPVYWGGHFNQWVGYNPIQPFTSVFPTTNPALSPWSLGQAVGLPGGYNDVTAAFANDAVAALLNSSNPNIKYGISSGTIVNWALWAIGSNTYGLFNGIVEPLNSRPCPLPQ